MRQSSSCKKYRNIYQTYLTNYQLLTKNPSKFDKKYKKTYNFWHSYLFQFLKKNKKKDTKILDIGCGIGKDLYVLKKSGFESILGIDISQEHVNFANKILPVKRKDAFKFLQNKQNEYDIILLFWVIEHLTYHEIMKLLIFIRNSLKKNGQLIIQTHNSNYLFWGYRFFRDITHETIYNPTSLRRLLSLCNFNTNIFTVNSFSTWHPNLINRFFRKYILNSIAKITEKFLILISSLQGNYLKNNKPVLIAVCKK